MKRSTKDPVMMITMALITLLFAELFMLSFFANTAKIEAAVKQRESVPYEYRMPPPNASPMAREAIKNLFH